MVLPSKKPQANPAPYFDSEAKWLAKGAEGDVLKVTEGNQSRWKDTPC
jgi:hypothetical protein